MVGAVRQCWPGDELRCCIGNPCRGGWHHLHHHLPHCTCWLYGARQPLLGGEPSPATGGWPASIGYGQYAGMDVVTVVKGRGGGPVAHYPAYYYTWHSAACPRATALALVPLVPSVPQARGARQAVLLTGGVYCLSPLLHTLTRTVSQVRGRVALRAMVCASEPPSCYHASKQGHEPARSAPAAAACCTPPRASAACACTAPDCIAFVNPSCRHTTRLARLLNSSSMERGTCATPHAFKRCIRPPQAIRS